MNKNNLKRGFSGIAAIGIVAAVVVVVIMFGYSVTSKNTQTNELAVPADKMEQESVKADDMADDNPQGEKMVTTQAQIAVVGQEGSVGANTEGSYQIYDPAKLSMADNGKVVLFFNASWCPTCRGADAELKGAKIPDNLTVLSVDYDKYAELKKKYGVTYQHTFVQVDAKGNMIAKWSGGGLTDIISNIK